MKFFYDYAEIKQEEGRSTATVLEGKILDAGYERSDGFVQNDRVWQSYEMKEDGKHNVVWASASGRLLSYNVLPGESTGEFIGDYLEADWKCNNMNLGFNVGTGALLGAVMAKSWNLDEVLYERVPRVVEFLSRGESEQLSPFMQGTTNVMLTFCAGAVLILGGRVARDGYLKRKIRKAGEKKELRQGRNLYKALEEMAQRDAEEEPEAGTGEDPKKMFDRVIAAIEPKGEQT